jgi:restriction system protein
MVSSEAAIADKCWVVRAGRSSIHVRRFLDQGLIALGAIPEFGADALCLDREQLFEKLRLLRPDWRLKQAAAQSNQLARFLHELQIGDRVATYDSERRNFYLGTITGPARFESASIEELPYVRTVRWDRRVARDSLSVEARNSLGAILSLFAVRDAVARELEEKATQLEAPDTPSPQPPRSSTPLERDDLDHLRVEIREKAAQFIGDIIVDLDWDELQELVAGILRAMGYKTRVSATGPDRGVDIFASPDGLGLEEPRIFVEVKHRPREPIGAPVIRAFLGGRRTTDRCLYVSTGGFTREAHYEAERSGIPLRLLALEDLQALLVEHYDQMDAESRSLVPLTKVYWPIARHDGDGGG